MDKIEKSKEWTEILKTKGWDDAYLSGDAFAKFLAERPGPHQGGADVGRPREVVRHRGNDPRERRTPARRFFLLWNSASRTFLPMTAGGVAKPHLLNRWVSP